MVRIKFIFENYTLLSFHEKNQVKVCFEAKLHIINEFSINLIFRNDVLMFQKKISIWSYKNFELVSAKK